MTDDRSPRSYRRSIPVLTEIVEGAEAPAEPAPEPAAAVDENRLAELQTELASQTYQLADRLLHQAFTEMEAALFEEVSNRLRKELPDLIDRILREQLGLQA